MRTAWTFQVDNQVHTVTLDHGWIDAHRLITLDGVEIERVLPRMIVDWGSRHEFLIGTHHCTVIIKATLLSVQYDLEINGVSIKTGRFDVRENLLLRAAEKPQAAHDRLLRPAARDTQNSTRTDQLLRAAPDSSEKD